MDDKIQKYKVASAENLWDPIVISVHKNTIIECSDKRSVEVGADFTSMKKYWEQFDGENKHLITPITDTPEL